MFHALFGMIRFYEESSLSERDGYLWIHFDSLWSTSWLELLSGVTSVSPVTILCLFLTRVYQLNSKEHVIIEKCTHIIKAFTLRHFRYISSIFSLWCLFTNWCIKLWSNYFSVFLLLMSIYRKLYSIQWSIIAKIFTVLTFAGVRSFIEKRLNFREALSGYWFLFNVHIRSRWKWLDARNFRYRMMKIWIGTCKLIL